MKALADTELTIIGTGLMGTSLAMALRGKVAALHGVDANAESRELAAPSFDTMAPQANFASSDVIALATPVQTILRLLDHVRLNAHPGTLIFDLGSAKRPIVAAMDRLPDTLLAVGGHPMCGKETSGPSSADGTIYRGCMFALCPTERSTPETLVFMEALVGACASRPIVMSAEQHDRAVASISHLPYLLSAGLVATVSRSPDDAPWMLASSGFRDTSRLAASDVTMMGDTVLSNRDAVLDAIHLFTAQLAEIELALRSGDEIHLKNLLDDARQMRLWWANRQEKEL
ncbi:MAG TPA: prephenate dehydrogenase [Aggregatilineales bacterium]|nr:prephenate dehydrogenase [Aggregatilineales bacterium]